MKKFLLFLSVFVFAFSLDSLSLSKDIFIHSNDSILTPDSLKNGTIIVADSVELKADSVPVRSDSVIVVSDTVQTKKAESRKGESKTKNKSKGSTVRYRKPSELEIFKDSVAVIYKRVFLTDTLAQDSTPLVYDVNMYRLFVAPILYSEPISKKMMPDKKKEITVPSKSVADSFQDSLANYTQVRDLAKDDFVNSLLYNLYLTEFELDYVAESEVENYASFEPVVIQDEEIKEKVFSLFKPENDYREYKQVETKISISKPNFWKLQGNGSVQFSQNYISPNWYKGGESSNSILSYLMFNANYNDKQMIEFDNRIEAKVGFMTVPSDTIHKYNITSDLLRLTSKLGVKAYDRWYYTLYAEFNTQFFNNYKVNTNTRVSSFMSPANLIINLGLDYKLSLAKIELSTLYSPLTYNFRYVSDPLVDPTQFGVSLGEKVLHTFGSSFQVNMRWTIIPSIIWESRLNYFTNYHKIETEWENTYNFVLNRYLSAKLFVHARFYDMEAEHKVQWNELFSFGINYNW